MSSAGRIALCALPAGVVPVVPCTGQEVSRTGVHSWCLTALKPAVGLVCQATPGLVVSVVPADVVGALQQPVYRFASLPGWLGLQLQM